MEHKDHPGLDSPDCRDVNVTIHKTFVLKYKHQEAKIKNTYKFFIDHENLFDSPGKYEEMPDDYVLIL
jgi:hypothetical protein